MVDGGRQNGSGKSASAGRVVIADSVTNTGLISANAGSQESFAGSGGDVLNPFIIDSPTSTPNVIGLKGGADGYGIYQNIDANDNFFASVNLNAPNDAIAAILLSNQTPLGDEYDNHLSLSLINLSSATLTDVGLGITAGNDSLTANPIQSRGFKNNPLFGGGGPKTLTGLGGNEVYTTLVPDSSLRYNFTASGLSLSEMLTDGAFVYLRASSGLTGDFDQDGDVDADDIDFYIGNLGMPATGALTQLDLDNDGQVTLADHHSHVTNLVQTSNGQTGTFLGDINLDGVVNVLGDAFILVGNLGNSNVGWSDGNLNADGNINVLGDAFPLVGNLGSSNNPTSSAATSAVPEPNSTTLLLLLASGIGCNRRRKH